MIQKISRINLWNLPLGYMHGVFFGGVCTTTKSPLRRFNRGK